MFLIANYLELEPITLIFCLIKILNMLDQGAEGLEGEMSAKKYIFITKTSKATATRDLQDLVDKNVLTTEGAGRSVRYELNI